MARPSPRRNLSPPSKPFIETAIAFLLGVTAALSLLVTDAGAHSSFDAPKLLVAVIGVVVCGVLTITSGRGLPYSRRSRRVLVALAACVTLAIVSASLSAHIHSAVAALRLLAIYLVLAFVIASDRSARNWNALLTGYVAASAVNAALSLLQSAGVIRLFDYASVGGRRNTSALIGNDGLLSLTLSFAAVIVIGWLLEEGHRKRRGLQMATLLLLLAGVATNRNVTAVFAIAAGAGAYALRSSRQYWITVTLVIVTTSAGLFFFIRSDPRAALTRIDRVVSQRVGVWGAAISMVASHPLLGAGPGSFEREFATHRILADARVDLNLVNTANPGGYAEAHADLLQMAAETGIPVTLVATALWLLLPAAMWRPVAGGRIVRAVLIAGFVGALTWFPLHRPGTAMLLVAAAARAWVLSTEDQPS